MSTDYINESTELENLLELYTYKNKTIFKRELKNCKYLLNNTTSLCIFINKIIEKNDFDIIQFILCQNIDFNDLKYLYTYITYCAFDETNNNKHIYEELLIKIISENGYHLLFNPNFIIDYEKYDSEITYAVLLYKLRKYDILLLLMKHKDYDPLFVDENNYGIINLIGMTSEMQMSIIRNIGKIN